VYFVFLVHTLHLTAAMIGVLFTLAGHRRIRRRRVCDRLVDRFGLLKLLVGGQVVLIAGGVLLACAAGGRWPAGAFIVAGKRASVRA